MAFRYYYPSDWAGGQCFVMGVVGWGNYTVIPFSFILGDRNYPSSVEHLVFKDYTAADGPNGSNRTYRCFYLETDALLGAQHRIYIYMFKNASYRGINWQYYNYDIVDKSLLPT